MLWKNKTRKININNRKWGKQNKYVHVLCIHSLLHTHTAVCILQYVNILFLMYLPFIVCTKQKVFNNFLAFIFLSTDIHTRSYKNTHDEIWAWPLLFSFLYDVIQTARVPLTYMSIYHFILTYTHMFIET